MFTLIITPLASCWRSRSMSGIATDRIGANFLNANKQRAPRPAKGAKPGRQTQNSKGFSCWFQFYFNRIGHVSSVDARIELQTLSKDIRCSPARKQRNLFRKRLAHLPWRAVFAGHELAGFAIVNDLFFLHIPADFSPRKHGDQTKVSWNSRVMSNFHRCNVDSRVLTQSRKFCW